MRPNAAPPITQAEWFSPKNYLWLINAVDKLPIARTKVGRRKFRLFSCACCRQVWSQIADDVHRDLVELAEHVAEGAADMDDLQSAYREMRKVKEALLGLRGIVGEAVRGVAEKQASRGAMRALGQASYLLAVAALPEGYSIPQLEAQAAVAEAAFCELLREMFGNPFRPVTLDRAWLTPEVTRLAHAAYDERLLPSGELDRQRLAILADALEEAGCTSADALDHLRGPGTHVRGCWLVDRLTGRE